MQLLFSSEVYHFATSLKLYYVCDIGRPQRSFVDKPWRCSVRPTRPHQLPCEFLNLHQLVPFRDARLNWRWSRHVLLVSFNLTLRLFHASFMRSSHSSHERVWQNTFDSPAPAKGWMSSSMVLGDTAASFLNSGSPFARHSITYDACCSLPLVFSS